MTSKGTQSTGRKDSQGNGHPSVSDEMNGMMGNCGCGPMMAKMMAACMGAAGTEDTAKAEGGEPQDAEKAGRSG